jgi:hypothetical protein
MIVHYLDVAMRHLKRGPASMAFMVAALGVGLAASAGAAPRGAGGQRAAGAQNVPPSAYQCTAGSQVWIQMDPCPRIYLKDPQDEDAAPSVDADPVRMPPALLERVSVHQRKLDAPELCRELDDHKVPLKHHGSSDVYERNLAKSRFCH